MQVYSVPELTYSDGVLLSPYWDDFHDSLVGTMRLFNDLWQGEQNRALVARLTRSSQVLAFMSSGNLLHCICVYITHIEVIIIIISMIIVIIIIIAMIIFIIIINNKTNVLLLCLYFVWDSTRGIVMSIQLRFHYSVRCYIQLCFVMHHHTYSGVNYSHGKVGFHFI